MKKSPIAKHEENPSAEIEIEQEALCKLCGCEDQPLAKGHTPKKVRRSRKISTKAAANIRKEAWIACCVCDSWFHIRCVGITKTENQKLKGKAFFKCILCCFDAAKAFQQSLESALNIHIISSNGNSRQRAENSPEQPEIKCQLFRETDKDANTTENLPPVTPQSVVSFLDSCLEKEHQIKEQKDLENSKVLESEKSDKLQVGKGKNRLESKIAGKKRADLRETEKTEDSRPKTKVEQYLLWKEEEKEARSKIIVIDEIPDSSNFLSSKDILKEFNKYCDEISVTAAFRLAKGGISIYLKSTEDRDSALKKLSKDSFGGGKKRSLSEYKTIPIFLKGIDTAVNTCTVEETVEKKVGKLVKCTRLYNYNTGRPRQVIKVLCSQETAARLVSSEIYLGDKKITVETSRNREVIRCYNCQAFGHISAKCLKKPNCINCSGTSCSTTCGNDPYCSNCQENHPSSDRSCTSFVQQNKIIASEYTIGKHIRISPESSDTTTSA